MTTHERPRLRVVTGNPTAEELAVITAVISAAASGAPEPAQQVPSRWSSPEARTRRPLRSGPGGWRASTPLR